jgi:hypothetical protein
MAAPIRPAATKAFGAEKWVFVPTIADPTAPKLSTELNAAGALDVTKMFFSSSARPDASANMAKAERRLGDVESFEFVGETSYTLGEVRYSFNPQGAGQFVTSFPVEAGPQVETTEGDGESAEVAIKQSFAITGPPSIKKAIVA